MPGSNGVSLGPFAKGMFNAAGTGEFIADNQVFELINLEVDLDGSLANRPPIARVIYTGSSAVYTKIVGTFNPSNGKHYLVLARASQVGLLDISTGSVVLWSGAISIDNPAVCQYRERLYVIGDALDAGNGGFFDGVPATPTWTALTLPHGGAMWVFKERLHIAAGTAATSSIASLRISDIILTPTTAPVFPVNNILPVDDNNGQNLVTGLVVGQELLLLKEHSAYRFSYESNPTTGILTQVSSNIGVPNRNCAVTYDNNTVYLLHADNVYEMYNFQFSHISDPVRLDATNLDADLHSDMYLSLSQYRERLLVRYYGDLYGYNINTSTWCRWNSTKKFSKMHIIPSTFSEPEVAFMGSASLTHLGEIYKIVDDRITGIGTDESFNCSIVSKTYDFDSPSEWKRMWQWGISMATSGNTTTKIILPGALQSARTWKDVATMIWSEINPTKWGEPQLEIGANIIPPRGGFARKFVRAIGACRFMRVIFVLETEAKPNSVADAAVRIYDIIAYIRTGEMAKDQVS